MIWQQTPLGYLVQVLILGQPFLWMWLYASRLYIEWAEHTFYAVGILTIVIINVTGFSIGFYRSHILIEYVGMTIFAAILFSDHHRFKEAVSLAFLTVFLNSFYWELPWHLMEYTKMSFYPAQLVQLWRLTPLLFFFRRYRFDKHSLNLALLGPVISTAFVWLRINVFNKRYGMRIPYAINRIICVYILINIIMDAQKKEDAYPG